MITLLLTRCNYLEVNVLKRACGLPSFQKQLCQLGPASLPLGPVNQLGLSKALLIWASSRPSGTPSRDPRYRRLALDEAPAVFLPLTSLLPKLLEEKNFLPLPSIKLGPDGGKEGRGVVGSLGHGDQQDFCLPCPPKFCPVWVPWLALLVSHQPPPAHPAQLHPCPGPPYSAQQPPTWLTWRIQLGIFHLRWGRELESMA